MVMLNRQKRARIAAFALVFAGACTGTSAASTVHHTAKKAVAQQFGAISVDVTGDAPVAVRAAVRKTLDDYVARATTTALKTGKADDLTPIFTADALAGANGADHATLVDEGIAGVKTLRSSTATAVVSSIGDEVAAVRFDMSAVALVDATPVTIHRTGDIVLVVENGAWRIDSYDLKVTRDSQDAPAGATP